MTTIFSDGALHPGRDPNDAIWLVLRRAEDWAPAVRTHVVFDPARSVLELEPGPLGGGDAGSEIVGPDGTTYRSDPDGDLVWMRSPCDEWRRLVGPRGTETGKLIRPLGLALDARRGLLAIADSGNHRVQVVRAGTGEPVVSIGCFDAWGRGVASSDPRALGTPTGVAFGGLRLAVADRERVHVYDDRFELAHVFAPLPPGVPAGFTPAPVAVAVVGCIVWVVDAGWSSPVAYGLDGTPVANAGTPPEDLDPQARWQPAGELVLGPIDGRSEDLAWHRVIVDAIAPAGTSIQVQTFASDDPVAPPVIAWAPAHPVAIPLVGVEPRDGQSDRPVLSDQGRWARKRGEPYYRIASPIAVLAGTGPISSAGFPLAWPAGRRLRAGDVIELRAGALSQPRPIAAIGGRTLQATARGTLQVYGPGSMLSLLERDGEPVLGGSRLLWVLGATDTLDASGAADDGTLYELPASHAVAALLRDGDIVTIDAGGVSAILVIALVARDDVAIALAAPVVGDFSTSEIRVTSASGRLLVDGLDWTDDAPPGEAIVVHDDIAGTEVTAALRWAERDAGALWLEPGPPVPWDTWTRFTLPDPVATDRGRYLWLRLHLTGAVAHAGDALATATPAIRAVRLLLPRPSLLRWLPAVYARRDADDPSGALFLERLLALPEHQLTSIEALYESVARQLNPLAASPEWLAFIGMWFGLVFDPSWPIARRRELLVHANELFAKCGTVAGMVQYLEIYTGATPAIVEDFRYRDARPHHFSIWVFGSGGPCGAALTERAARAIVESTKPAHTTYDLHVIDEVPRIGISSTVGVDMVLVGGEVLPPIGLASQPPAVLGRTVLPPTRPEPTCLGPIPIDGDFTLS